MQTAIHDAHEIAQLVGSWALLRDQSRWDALDELFIDDGVISISWMHGPHSAFVAASRLAAEASLLQVKHQMGMPFVLTREGRATAETDVTIMVRATIEGCEADVTSYARFFDRLERTSGRWRFRQRTAIYERDRIDPVFPHALPDDLLANGTGAPAALRCLAGALGKLGLTLSPHLVVDRSPALQALQDEAAAWLESTP